MAIDSLRNNLLALTHKLIDQLNQRKEIVQSIQSFKNENNLESYDYQRELIVFKEFNSSLTKMSLKELFLFSLMIETHAGESYPQWSESTHLNSCHNHLREKINPLLLLLLLPAQFKMLDLKDEFKANLNE